MQIAGPPPSEAVFRRLYVTVIHEEGVSLVAKVFVDGRLVDDPIGLVRVGQGYEERHTFMAAFNPTRGSVVEIELESKNPSSRWFLETVSVGVNLRNQARGVRVGGE
jgi:hypothetical protein